MTHPIRNTPASVHARLANRARKLGRPFAELLQEYGMERFLYRLTRTEYAKSFILKGGLIFNTWDIPLRRPTRDIDFLSELENRQATMLTVFRATLAVPVPEDGLFFDPDSLVIGEAQVDADTAGLRVTFLGYLGKAQIPMQIDIGFSDVLTEPVEVIHYPVLLSGMQAPVLTGYPPVTVIAEKFQAMERYAMVPSRWKDYYDVWLISGYFELEDDALRAAILGTFENRSTPLPKGRPYSLSRQFARLNADHWKVFIAKLQLPVGETEDLSGIVDQIWGFLDWPLGSSTGSRRWYPEQRKWFPRGSF